MKLLIISKSLCLFVFSLLVFSCSDKESFVVGSDSIEVKLSDYVNKAENHSEAIRNCLNECANYETKIIHFDLPLVYIEEAILLDDNTTLILEGCTIKQKDHTFDNVIRGNNLTLDENDPFGIPLRIDSIRNIKIVGIGNCKIIGPDENAKIYHPVKQQEEYAVGDFYGWRTLQVSFSLGSNIEISGISFEQTRCWAISFDKCSHVSVHDLSIYSNCKNGDGINFRSGCHHCEAYNIIGETSDDTVACSALGSKEKRTYPRGNYLYPMEPSVNLSPEMNRDIFDIDIHHVSTAGSEHGIILLTANDNEVYNISISDFSEPLEQTLTKKRVSIIYLYTGYGDISSSNKIHMMCIFPTSHPILPNMYCKAIRSVRIYMSAI